MMPFWNQMMLVTTSLLELEEETMETYAMMQSNNNDYGKILLTKLLCNSVLLNCSSCGSSYLTQLVKSLQYMFKCRGKGERDLGFEF